MATKTAKEFLKDYGGWEEDKKNAAQIRTDAISAGTWGGDAYEYTPPKVVVPESVKTAADKLWDRGSQTLSKPTLAKLKADEAEKKLEDYRKSDTFRKKLAQREKKLNQDQFVRNLLTGIADIQQPQMVEDETEVSLREAAERARAEATAEADAVTAERDQEDYEKLSDEDKTALEQYAANQIRDQNIPLEMAGMMPTAREEAADLTAKIGQKRVDELAETYMRDENAALAEAVETTGRQLAGGDEGGFWRGAGASVVTIPAQLMGAIAGTVGQLQGAARRTGRYTTLDANETGTALEKFSGAVRGQVAENIEGKDPRLLRKGASFLYQGGMSFLDSTARMLASGGSSGISSAIAAMGGFSSALQKFSAMGVSPEKAALAATASAGLEYMTEKLPTDELLKLFHKGGKDTSVVKNILKQAFLTEPATEEVNLFAGVAAECLILGDQSSKAQRIGDLISGGMTREEAEKQFWKETWAEAAQTYAVSAVAGGLGAGGAVLAGNQGQQTQEQRAPQSAEDIKQQALEKVSALKQQEHAQASAEEPVVSMNGVIQMPSTEPEVEQLQQVPGENGTAPVENAPVQESAQQAPALTGAQQVQQVMEAAAAKVLQQEPAKAAPAGDPKQQLQQAMETVAGTQIQSEQQALPQNPGEQMPVQKPNPARLYPRPDTNTHVLPAAQQLQQAMYEISGANQGKTVDSGPVQRYNNTRSEQVQSAIDRLNLGGTDAPKLEEIMAIPEIAEAEAANQGMETINLPNREKIREAGYQKAMQKGSWDGKDYGGEVRQERRMDIVIGLPGSGKSSVYTERLSQEHKSRVIDTDDFREYIPEYSGSNASIVHEESSEIRDRVFDTALDNGDNILLSTIGANAEKLAKQIAAYKEDGYQVYLHLNELPNNKSLARAIGRYISEDGALGRYVSPTLIAGYGDKPTQTYLYLTGQGGKRDGELDGNLRTGGRPSSGDASETGGAAQSSAGAEVPADLLAGYDWYNNDVERGAPPRLIQTSDGGNAKSTSDGTSADAYNMTATANSPYTGDRETVTPVGGQQAAPVGPDRRASNTYMNTGLHSENANIRAGYRQELRKDPDAAMYTVKHNADTLAEARSRTGSPDKNTAALDNLMAKDHWTAEDVATSTLLLDEIMASGDADAIARLNDLRQKRKNIGVGAGQVSQAFSIHNETMRSADSPATAVDTFRKRLEGMKQEETTWSPKTGVDFETWKENLGEEADRIGIAIVCVEDGDSDSMRQIIRQIAQARKTTAWFGTSQNLTGTAWNVLKKMEFEDLKKIANTQLVAMADDFRARGTGEVVGGLRKQSMLSSLKTFVRNISGNTVGGFADAVSESGAGRMADAVLSHFTGKKTVGNDLGRTAEYVKAAKEAGQFASLCVELNIPIETDMESSFAAAAGQGSNEKYMGRTFRATGNPAMRAMYAYQKYMSYALEVTDKIFEGGSNAAVTESLNRLKNANLTEQDKENLAEFTANKRTFKNATWEEDGETKGSAMARWGAKIKNATGIFGEVAMPYVNVPMNVAQTGIDYTGGVAKGLGEMIGIIKDTRAGKTIPVERQRQAASDFGRGVTGTAMIAMFASAAAMGALKASNSRDWDKDALAQAEGRSGAQINWSALERGMKGESADWKTGDVISGLDFLEPFNTQMYLGAELAQAEDFNLLTYAGSTVKSVWQSLMDSPVMTGLADIEQTLNDISEAETVDDALNVGAGYAGDVASSFIPQFVRQTAQDQDGYYRDTRGDTALESAINSLMAAIPGQSQKLPKKYSGLGEVQERGSAVETFLDPTATKVFQENEVTTFLDDLDERLKDLDFDVDIYPDRQAPMRITVAGREVQLDGTMRETYQKTYGEQINALYRQLMDNPDFQTFSDELKAEALKEAKGFARQQAMAAVSDYREAPIGSAEVLAKGIVNGQIRSQFGGLFTDLDTLQEYGYSTEETAQEMEESYQAFQKLTPKTQKEIVDQAVGDTAKYLEVRQKGIKTEQFLLAAQNVDKAKGTGKNGSVREIDKRQAIAKTSGLSSGEIDTIMKAYMGDYDPKDPDSEKTELKYDYIRQELGLSPAAYVATYRAHLDNSKKAQKIAAIMAMGYDRKMATTLYNIYAGNAKGKSLYMP